MQLKGKATDYFDEPVNGPLMTTRADSTFIEDGHCSIYAEKDRPGVAVHRIEDPDIDGPADNIAEGFALPVADHGVNHLDVKLVPHLAFLLDKSTRGLLAYEAWNLPTTKPNGEERKYDLEIFGANVTYASRLRDADHDIVIHKLLGDTTGVFKPKRSELE